ncbi:MAG: tetratricopeptide repeat protein [Microscillaceae bacterium]|jgi:serine phosphatase RsbU (regulator of sigma subunit)|nr:tetratricopeptide repeat protein [Microscillaceae bacterium]
MKQTIIIGILTGILTLGSQVLSAQISKSDSLLQLLKKFSVQDTNRLKVLSELCWYHRNSSPEKSLLFGEEALGLAIKLNNSPFISKINTFLGTVHRNIGNYPKALSHYLDAVRIAEKTQDYERLGFGLQSIGDINQRQSRFEEADKYLQKALKSFSQIDNQMGIAYCYYTYGQSFEAQKKLEKALEYHQKAFAIRQKIKDKNGLSSSTFRIGGIYQKQKKYPQALQYFDQALENFKILEDKRGMMQVLNREAQIHLILNDLAKARQLSEQSLTMAKATGLIEQIQESYQNLTKIYQAQKDFDQAFAYQTLYLAYHDSLLNKEKSNQMLYLQTAFEDEKRQIQIQLLKEENQRKNLVLYAIAGGGLLVLLLAFVLYRNNLIKQKANQELAKANAEIEDKNTRLQEAFAEIEAQNIHIKDSIDYAQRIQSAMLPSVDKIKKVFPESFVIFYPRDIVSGDFYWLYELDNQIIMVVADCTGHGVPGALMSMIGESLLDQIVHERKIYNPGIILSELHKGIRTNLRQQETRNQDGMDIVICHIDFARQQMQFAGAMNPLFYIQNQQFFEIKANKHGVGGYFYENEKPTERVFDNHIIDISQPTMIYLFSDGYQDQFGGEKGRKFMLKRFREMLIENAKLPIDQQHHIFQETLHDWRGNTYEQTDDILLIGIKLS